MKVRNTHTERLPLACNKASQRCSASVQWRRQSAVQACVRGSIASIAVCNTTRGHSARFLPRRIGPGMPGMAGYAGYAGYAGVPPRAYLRQRVEARAHDIVVREGRGLVAAARLGGPPHEVVLALLPVRASRQG